MATQLWHDNFKQQQRQQRRALWLAVKSLQARLQFALCTA
jgi:hypothetical protein